MEPPSSFDSVRDAVARTGLRIRGAFHCAPDDGVPPVGAQPAGTLVLVGNAGRAGFRAFRESEFWGLPRDPLDAFTEARLGSLARELGALDLYPHRGPPWLAFQRWAMRAGPALPTPLGILIHPRHGLWHAYRGALAFPRRLEGVAPRRPAMHPCEDCAARPCLSACPVAAFTREGYDVAACAGHLATEAGTACLDGGCKARGACPVAADSRYGEEQRRFHMAAFARARGVRTKGN